MTRSLIRVQFVLILLALLAAACAPAEATPAGSPPTEAGSPTATAVASPQPAQTETSPTQAGPETPAASSGGVDYTLGFILVPEESEARYLVTEQLANVSLPSDAVGRTQAIQGTFLVNRDGSIETSESRFEVDLSTLQSDESRRDRFIKENTLETGQYPLAVFVPTGISGLPAEPGESGEFTFTLSGDLTIRETTRPVEWQVTAQLEEGRVTGTATTQITFEQFNLTQPRVPLVLSVEDEIRLEVDFTLDQRIDR